MFIHERDDWPRFRWDAGALSAVLADVRHRQGHLVGRMDGLGFRLREEAVLDTLTQDVVRSGEIEGESLDREQVRSSIARRLGLDVGALTPADRDVEGVVDMTLDATQRDRIDEMVLENGGGVSVNRMILCVMAGLCGCGQVSQPAQVQTYEKLAIHQKIDIEEPPANHSETAQAPVNPENAEDLHDKTTPIHEQIIQSLKTGSRADRKAAVLAASTMSALARKDWDTAKINIYEIEYGQSSRELSPNGVELFTAFKRHLKSEIGDYEAEALRAPDPTAFEKLIKRQHDLFVSSATAHETPAAQQDASPDAEQTEAYHPTNDVYNRDVRLIKERVLADTIVPGSAKFCSAFETLRNKRGNHVYIGWYKSKGLNGVEGQDNIIAELSDSGVLLKLEIGGF